MTDAQITSLIVAVGIVLLAFGSWGLYWLKWREVKLTNKYGVQGFKSMGHMASTELFHGFLNFVFGLSVIAGLLLLGLLVLKKVAG